MLFFLRIIIRQRNNPKGPCFNQKAIIQSTKNHFSKVESILIRHISPNNKTIQTLTTEINSLIICTTEKIKRKLTHLILIKISKK
jgi:hypothetical protein